MTDKDLINSFESLTPDHSQKERMLRNVLNSVTEKNVHKVSFNFRYAFSTAAAAVCVLAVVIAVGPMYKYHKISQNPSQKVISSDTAAEDVVKQPATDNVAITTDNTTDSKHTMNNKRFSADNALPEKADETADNLPEVFNSTETALEEDAAEEVEAAVSEKVPMMRNRMIMPESDKNADNSEVGHSGGGGGGGGIATAAAYGYETLSLKEYYDYLGTDVEEKVRIPAGFSNVTGNTVNINRDYDDKCTFTFEKGNSFIHIITTKHTDDVYQTIKNSYAVTDIGGKNAVVLKTENAYTAYMISGGVAYTIDTFGVSEEELDNLLLSIAG